MKKILLTISFGALALFASAQTIFNVDAPSSIEGTYSFEYADLSPAQDGSIWGVSDLTIPINSIVDTLALVDAIDTVEAGTPITDGSLGCASLMNAADVAGKIAVVYRGNCQFGFKAKMAQDAGAVGVIIINNVPGNPLRMAAGTVGSQVTIPVVMVSDLTGATLVNTMSTDDVVVFIGNKTGRYSNDLSIYQKDIRRPVTYGNVAALSQNASEFTTEMGAWVFNYGINTQFNVELTGSITFSGTTVYNNSVVAGTIQPGDSVYIGLPNYSQSSYDNGYYSIVYSVESDSTENYSQDNEVTTGFVMNDAQIAYSEIDSVTFEPIANSYNRTGTDGVNEFSACINYRNSNASRLAARGLTFSASTFNADDSTVNLVDVFIQVEAFKWEDNFTNLDDVNVANITQITSGDYDYSSDLQRENIYVDFQNAFVLEDNQRYLFCVKTENEDVYFGYTNSIDYTANQDTLNQPISVANSDGTIAVLGFGPDITPAISIETFPAETVSVDEEVEENLTVYPNPAKDMISIPVGNLEVSSVVVYDLTGKIVSSQDVSSTGNVLTLDVTSIPNGMYVVTLNKTDNTSSKINVVISK